MNQERQRLEFPRLSTRNAYGLFCKKEREASKHPLTLKELGKRWRDSDEQFQNDMKAEVDKLIKNYQKELKEHIIKAIKNGNWLALKA